MSSYKFKSLKLKPFKTQHEKLRTKTKKTEVCDSRPESQKLSDCLKFQKNPQRCLKYESGGKFALSINILTPANNLLMQSFATIRGFEILSALFHSYLRQIHAMNEQTGRQKVEF